MNLKKAAKRLKRTSLALLAVVIVCMTSGCNAVGMLEQLFYLSNWAGNLFTSGTAF